MWAAPFHPSIAMMEFRIFHNIFCDTYKIQKSAFAFNEYVEKVFEKYILMIIEIRPLDWFLVCLFVLLNWARVALHWDLGDCAGHHDDTYDDHHDDAGHRLLSGSGLDKDEISCREENETVMFTIAGLVVFEGFSRMFYNYVVTLIILGAVMFAITLCLAIESRRLEVAIMRQKGIKSVHTYPSYLKVSNQTSCRTYLFYFQYFFSLCA